MSLLDTHTQGTNRYIAINKYIFTKTSFYLLGQIFEITFLWFWLLLPYHRYVQWCFWLCDVTSLPISFVTVVIKGLLSCFPCRCSHQLLNSRMHMLFILHIINLQSRVWLLLVYILKKAEVNLWWQLFIGFKICNYFPLFNLFELLYGMGYSCLRIFCGVLDSCGCRVLWLDFTNGMNTVSFHWHFTLCYCYS